MSSPYSALPDPDEKERQEPQAPEPLWLQRLKVIPPWVWGVLLIAFFLGLLVASKIRPERFLHEEAGIELDCPKGWFKEVSKDKNLVIFYKDPPEKGGKDNSVCKVSIEWGNPYGADAAGYLENGVLVPARHTFGEANVNVLSGPEEVIKAKTPWSAVKFIVDYGDTYYVYATMANSRTFVITLLSKGYHSEDDEAVLERLLNSVKLEHKKEVRVFH